MLETIRQIRSTTAETLNALQEARIGTIDLVVDASDELNEINALLGAPNPRDV